MADRAIRLAAVVVVVVTTAVAGVVALLRVVTTATAMVKVALATLAVARALRTLASHGKTPATAAGMALGIAKATVPRHAASAAPKAHALHVTINHAFRVMKCNARTHAARASIWVSSATTSTNASQPATCQRGSHHLACQRAALVAAVAVTEAVAAAVVAAIAAAVAAETGGGAARAQVAAAEATRAAGFSADRRLE